MMHRRAFVGLLLSAPVAVLAACGGSLADDRNATTTALAGVGLPTPTPTVPPTRSGPAPTRAAMATASSTIAAAPEPAASGDATAVNVEGRDFAFTFDRASVPAGNVRFVFRNVGPSPHNFVLRGNGVNRETQIINMGRTETLSVNLRPGMYSYVCNIPGHEQLGMVGMFMVQ